VVLLKLSAKGPYIVKEIEPCPSSASCCVLLGYRIPEACQQAPLVGFHDRPVELLNWLRTRILECPQDLCLIFRIKFKIRIGFEKIAAACQYRYLASFSFADATLGRRRRDVIRPQCGRTRRSRFPGWYLTWQRSEKAGLGVGRDDAAQVLGKICRGGVAVLLSLGQRHQAGPFDFGREVANELTRWLRLVVSHLAKRTHLRPLGT
jgi:hypothetical protein